MITENTNETRTAPVSAPLDTQALPPLPRPRTVQPYTVSELLGIYDANNGDWCAIARAIEARYITELDAVYAAIAPYAERIAHLGRELELAKGAIQGYQNAENTERAAVNSILFGDKEAIEEARRVAATNRKVS